MRLFIRDDDTSYFTKVSELESAYNDIWKFGPINLAIIPYSVETFNQGELGSQYQNHKEFFIGDNLELVEFIKLKIAEKKVNIMLHGYNHLYRIDKNQITKYPFGIPEFIYSENHFERIEKGKLALEKLFDVEIKWFIPPSNSLTIETVVACDVLGLNIPLVLNLKSRLFRVFLDNPFNLIQNRLNKITKQNSPLLFNNHKEILCTSYTSVTDFNKLISYKGNEVIATHYWEVNKFPNIKLEIYKELIRFNFKLSSLNEL